MVFASENTHVNGFLFNFHCVDLMRPRIFDFVDFALAAGADEAHHFVAVDMVADLQARGDSSDFWLAADASLHSRIHHNEEKICCHGRSLNISKFQGVCLTK
jgi:hypothetical protein